MTDNELFAVLESADLRPRRSNGQWAARCPCHEDKHPSMSARATSDGTVLVHCHAGCSGKAILAALGLLGASRPVFESPRPAERARPPTIADSGPSVREAWVRLVAECPKTEPDAHEDALGIPAGGLLMLGAVWAVSFAALAAPMYDRPGGEVVGVRLRADDGRKWAVTGSHNALFAPRTMTGNGPLYIPEGLTDTAAMLGLGFDAVGRPSATGGRNLVLALANGRPMVVVADADEPGQDGAWALAQELKSKGCSVKVLSPPTGIKDAREWVKRGATRASIEWATAHRGEE